MCIRDSDWINGLSLLGGEPFEPENQKVLLPFLIMFKERFPNKTIWCYTGFTPVSYTHLDVYKRQPL